VLTGLEELRLGRLPVREVKIGGCLDARALGSLARFPSLRGLEFTNCSVLMCPSFQAAAAHPRLERLQLSASYPAPGPSFLAVMGFVTSLLQRGRPKVLELSRDVIEGAGRRNSCNFCAALQAAEYPLSDADSYDLV